MVVQIGSSLFPSFFISAVDEFFLDRFRYDFRKRNLLPIPILDGGHILFFTLEAVLGKPIGIRKLEMAQKVGMVLLLVLMVFVFYNDIMRLIPGHKPDILP